MTARELIKVLATTPEESLDVDILVNIPDFDENSNSTGLVESVSNCDGQIIINGERL